MSKQALLAEYLATNPVWVEMIQVLEETWGDQLQNLVQQIANSRDLFQTDSTDLLKYFKDYKLPDRETMQRICSMLGFTYPNIDNQLFSTEDYLRIAQNIAAYYKEQGSDSFLNFFSFCMNYLFSLVPQWTKDYVNFYNEGDAIIGTPIWDGGQWYPTSHVCFVAGVGDVLPDKFVEFFNYMAPINLVLLATKFQSSSTLTHYTMIGALISVHIPSDPI